MAACGFSTEQWYLSAPGASSFPPNYTPCVANGVFNQRCGSCNCRQIESATNSSGAVVQFVWCIQDQDCSATVCGSGSGSVPAGSPTTSPPATTAPGATTAAPVVTTAAPVATTAAPVATTAAPVATTAAPAVTTAAPATTAPIATTETPVGTVAAANFSASGSGWVSTDDSASDASYSDWSDSSAGSSSVSAQSTATGSSSKTVVAAVLIGVGVLVIALLCLCIRSRCKKRSERPNKQFGATATMPTARQDLDYPPAFGIITGQQGNHPATTGGRSRSGSRGNRSSRPAVLESPQSIPMIAASQVSSNSNGNSNGNAMSQYSGDSRDTRSSGGSVFSASVTNNGAAMFSVHGVRQAPANNRGRRVRRVEERSTESSDMFALSPGPTSSRSGTAARETAGFKWSVYSDDSQATHHERSTVGRGMSSMISDYSDIDGRSTHYRDRDTTGSVTSFFSDDSEFDLERELSRHGHNNSHHV